MPNLNVLVKSKEESEKIVTNTLQEYIGKYMRKVYKTIVDEDSKSSVRCFKEFQKVLLTMARWSDLKVTREYGKYVKWCKNNGYIEELVQMQFDNIITLSSQIMLYKFNSNLTYESFSLKVLFYKCLKRIARHYYELPKTVHKSKESQSEKDILVSYIMTNINSFIPLDKIFEIMQEEEENEMSYDFNKSISENNIETLKKNRFIVEKESTRSLRYLSSDDFNNEYYNSDNSDNCDGMQREAVKEIEDDVKYINVPKLKSGYSKQKYTPLILTPKPSKKTSNTFTN